MFLIRNKALSWGVRHSRDIYKSNQPRRSSSKEEQNNSQQEIVEQQTQQPTASSLEFPYKFGGINKYPIDKPLLLQVLPKDTPNFFTIYLEFLQAAQEQNQTQLSKLIEPSLVPHFMNQNIKTTLSNSSRDGQVLAHQLYMTVGSFFKRDKSIKLTRMGNHGPQIGMYGPANLDPSNYVAFGGIPILASFQTTILSKCTLVPKGLVSSQRQEAHSILFQYQSFYKLQDMLKLIPVMAGLKAGVKPSPEAIKDVLFKAGSSWRIGNIDHFLPSRWE